MRITEAFFATFLFLILLPVFLALTILIKVTSKGPALHWSKRVGINNQLFLMPKFRTMLIDTPQLATHLITNEKIYLTPFGSFLRKTSLDEIPQLISIIKGDMSFIGPRPALFNQDDLIELRTKNNIHLLRPGVTGWAQVNGRDEISIEQKVEYEIEYSKNMSASLDLKIIFFTLFKVLTKKDVKH
ncbi:MAG: sugar transferase [Bdellovibrionota bacterium]|nr:sugar transferase [Bdellovibrionota bacterium]